MGGANQSISAGPLGFLAFFVLALVLWLLMRNMSGRLRRVRFAEELEDERRAEEGRREGVTVRPSRRPLFLPVSDDETAEQATGPGAPVTGHARSGGTAAPQASAAEETSAEEASAEEASAPPRSADGSSHLP